MKSSVPERLLIVIGGLICGFFIGDVVFGGADWVYGENESMELVQLVWLTLSTVLFWFGFRRHPSGVLHWLTGGAVLLSASFFLRELSLNDVAPDWVVYWSDGSGFRWLMVAVWVPWLSRLKRYEPMVWQVVESMLYTRTSFRLFMATVCLVIGGGVFDNEIYHPELFGFCEKLLELNGYVAFALAAFSLPRELAAVQKTRHVNFERMESAHG